MPSWDLILGRGVYFLWAFWKGNLRHTKDINLSCALKYFPAMCLRWKGSKGEAEVRQWKSLAAAWYCYAFHTYREMSPPSPSDSRGTSETLPFAPELAQQLSSSKSYAQYWIYIWLPTEVVQLTQSFHRCWFFFLPISPSSTLQLVSEPILHESWFSVQSRGGSSELSTPALLVLCPRVVPLGHLAVMVSGCSLWDRNNTAQQTSLQESELNTQNQARSSYTGNGLVPLSDGELCFFILSRELRLFSCSGLGTLKIQDLHCLGYVSEHPLLSSHQILQL